MTLHKPWLSLLAIFLLFTGPVLALVPPTSWSDLEGTVLPLEKPPLTVDWNSRAPKDNSHQDLDPSISVLFRERHGWCHFSTRVWLALECKGVVHYHTHLVESRGDTFDGADVDDINYDRPDFLKDLTLPRLLLPESDQLHSADTEDDLLNLLQLIDETFQDNDIVLFPSDEAWEAARAFQDCLPLARESRRAAWLFCAQEGYRLDSLPREIFEGVLDRAEEWLNKSPEQGPFFCGSSLTAADFVWTPLLERYAAQLPCLHRGLKPRFSSRWPRLQQWYRAMDQVPAYACRVQGDAPSWRKVLYSDPWWPRADLWHPRDTVGPKGELQATEEECVEAFGGGMEQEDDVWSRYAATRPYVAQQSPVHEAARILIQNRQAILKDSSEWLYEEGYDTLSDEDLDATLRCVVSLLIQESEWEDHHQENVATLLTYLDARMCVPRDMGNLPATSIRRLCKQSTKQAIQKG